MKTNTRLAAVLAAIITAGVLDVGPARAAFVGGVEHFDGTVKDTATWFERIQGAGYVTQNDSLVVHGADYTTNFAVPIGTTVSTRILEDGPSWLNLSTGDDVFQPFDEHYLTLSYSGGSFSCCAGSNGGCGGVILANGAPVPTPLTPYTLELAWTASGLTCTVYRSDNSVLNSVSLPNSTIAFYSGTLPGSLRVSLYGVSPARFDDVVAPAPPICGNGVVDAGEQCDDQNLVGGDCCSATCTIEPAETVCRVASGTCDVQETCNGASSTCPIDVKSTAACRAAGGVCDIAETCDGVSNDCPADAKSSATCRAAAGVCDVAETCDGVGNDCPADAKITTECRASTGPCDPAEVCDGSANGCPTDAVLPDDDGDALCNDVDPCTNGARATKPKLKITRALAPSGDEGMKLSGTIMISTVPTIDPVAKGARILVTDATGATVFDDLLPAVAYGMLGKFGWKVNGQGTSWKYMSPANVLTDTLKASLKAVATTPGLYKFIAVVGLGNLPVQGAQLPLTGTFVIDSPTAETGQCGEAIFDGPPGPVCTATPSGTTINCK